MDTRPQAAAPVENWRSPAPLPWEAGHRLRGPEIKPGLAWRHTIFLGSFSIAGLYESLDEVFTPDEESYDERPPGDSAIAALVVNEHGLLNEDQILLSSCAWATGRSVSPGPQNPRWLDGLSEAEELFREEVWAAIGDGDVADPTAAGDSEPRPITGSALLRLRDLARSFVDFASADGVGIRIRSVKVRRDSERTPDDFLNSFFVEDLRLVADRLRVGEAGPGLAGYLTAPEQIDRPGRIDVRSALEEVYAVVQPTRLPPGRWPSDERISLALSQQLAVNLVLAPPSPELFAVNGPPGTGKTTMLRDLVAGQVTARAAALANLKTPGDAFVGTHRWKSGDYTVIAHQLRDELVGHEMVVASSNNAAVANVSTEIPASDAIDNSWQGHSDYFAELATELLQPPKGQDAVDESSPAQTVAAGETSQEPRQGWALVAARLGKMDLRTRFRQVFWFNSHPPRPGATPDFQHLLGGWKADGPLQPWEAAVTDFRRTETAAVGAVLERQSAFDAERDQQTLSRELRTQELGFVRQQNEAEVAEHRRHEAERSLAEAESVLADVTERRMRHQRFRPGFGQFVVTLGRATREWNKVEAPLAAAMTDSDAHVQRAKQDLKERAQEAENASRGLAAVEHQLGRMRTRLAEHAATMDAALKRWGAAVPDQSWWRDETRRELVAPWLDEEVNRLRTAHFLAALHLHKVFFSHVATPMEQSLRAAMSVLAGEAPPGLDVDKARAAWQVFFLVVPLVSTTFASYARLFRNLGRESLGWLLVDEAGQAAPQQAVGAIWRSQHTVVVGDPRQLTPVVTIPERLQNAIAHQYGVPAKWWPRRTSVQQLADEVNRWGTLLATDDEPLWVGAPLRVHRRCDAPMFGVSNTVAYTTAGQADKPQGLMIDGVPPRPPFGAPASRWLHVSSSGSIGHYIPAELNMLRRCLDSLMAGGNSPQEIICVSPFRDTARELEKLTDEYGRELRAGTIHTAQGQEANIVFLVLGGDPSKPGAKRWASHTPNLLNVAISRAKRRCYVIGDRTAWSEYPFFNELIRALERHEADDGG